MAGSALKILKCLRKIHRRNPSRYTVNYFCIFLYFYVRILWVRVLDLEFLETLFRVFENFVCHLCLSREHALVMLGLSPQMILGGLTEDGKTCHLCNSRRCWTDRDDLVLLGRLLRGWMTPSWRHPLGLIRSPIWPYKTTFRWRTHSLTRRRPSEGFNALIPDSQSGASTCESTHRPPPYYK